MIRRYEQFESRLDNIWPLLLSLAQGWGVPLTSSSWRATPWREVSTLLRRAERLPVAWTTSLRDVLVDQCLPVLARCAGVSKRHLLKLRTAVVRGQGSANPTTATFCKVLFAAGFGIPLLQAPGEAIELGPPSANQRPSFREDVKAEKSHRAVNRRGRPRQGFLRNVPPLLYNRHGLRNWSARDLMPPMPPSRSGDAPLRAPPKSSDAPINAPHESSDAPLDIDARPSSGGGSQPPTRPPSEERSQPQDHDLSGDSSSVARAEPEMQEHGTREQMSRSRSLALRTKAHRKTCSKGHVERREKGPSLFVSTVEQVRYPSIDLDVAEDGGVGVMAKSKFDDLHDDLDQEVLELRPKGREPDSQERMLSMMAEWQHRQAEWQHRQAEWQRRQMESQASKDELHAKIALGIQAAGERHTHSIKESAGLHLQLITQLSERIGERFDRLEKTSEMAVPESLTVKDLLAQQLLELLQVGMVLGKKYMEEKIND